MKRFARQGILLVLLPWMLPANGASAGSVVPMDLPTLADHAGQVIIGTVASVRSRWSSRPGRIESIVAFQDVSYIKGALPDATDRFTLTVPGGTVGNRAMQVCCAPAFVPGQKWLLFLLPGYYNFPVVGLYQGGFLIQRDDRGVERVVQPRHGIAQAVVGVDASGQVQLADPARSAPGARLRAATGVRLTAPAGARPAVPKPALSLESFLQALQPILDHSKAHTLTAQAGQPLHASRRTMPLLTTSLPDAVTTNRPSSSPNGLR
ncbi:MAG: hypothetical protein ACE5GE_16565, partial [Phycisphaerae bacterium]